jgi:hypothetical protein
VQSRFVRHRQARLGRVFTGPFRQTARPAWRFYPVQKETQAGGMRFVFSAVFAPAEGVN